MEIDLHGFGRKVQTIRTERGMTQEQLAELASLSSHYIGNLEQGIKKPSLSTIMRLCAALGTTADDLLEDSLSSEMRCGIPTPVGDNVTFRDDTRVFSVCLSDLLLAEEGFGDPISYRLCPDRPSSKDRPVMLSDLLLACEGDALSDP